MSPLPRGSGLGIETGFTRWARLLVRRPWFAIALSLLVAGGLIGQLPELRVATGNDGAPGISYGQRHRPGAGGGPVGAEPGQLHPVGPVART